MNNNIRLNIIQKKLNITLRSAIDFLQIKNLSVVYGSNTKISTEECILLVNKFCDNTILKKEILEFINIESRSDLRAIYKENRAKRFLIVDQKEKGTILKDELTGHIFTSKKIEKAIGDKINMPIAEFIKYEKFVNSYSLLLEAQKSGNIIEGLVKSLTKGGLLVEILGIEAFLPGSEIDVNPINNYDIYIGKTMKFKVININPKLINIVISHKAVIEVPKKEVKDQLQKGQILEGIVKNIAPYGVFVNLGDIDGLIHITDLCWCRIKHPTEVLELDQKIKVVVLDFDDSKTRIKLGLKQRTNNPWNSLDAKLAIGDIAEGKVVGISNEGVYVEVAEDIDGLIPVSEISWSRHLHCVQDFIKKGDFLKAIIITLDRDEYKITLSIKQLTQDPWTDSKDKYAIDSKHIGIVRNIKDYGIFVELEAGIYGLIHISNLSMTKEANHLSELVNIGEELDVIVVSLDIDERKLSLRLNQTSDNPLE